LAAICSGILRLDRGSLRRICGLKIGHTNSPVYPDLPNRHNHSHFEDFEGDVSSLPLVSCGGWKDGSCLHGRRDITGVSAQSMAINLDPAQGAR